MVHPEIKRLLQEVFGRFSEEDGKRAGEHPEAYLVSLLERIQKRPPEVSAMLHSTVDIARFGSDTEKFQKILALVKKLATAQPNGGAQSRKVGKKSLKRRHLEKVAT